MSPPLTDEQAAKVQRHTGLVRAIARRVLDSVGEGALTFDELESVGNEALVQAALRYDPQSTQARGASFATFAHYRVYGAMIDALRKRTPGRRKRERAIVRLQSTQELLRLAAEDRAAQRAEGQQPTLEQRVEMARALVRKATIAVRLSEPETYDYDGAPTEDPNPEQVMLGLDHRRRLWRLVAELEAHERELIEAMYIEGLTMKEIADGLGTSISTISRRHARALERLSKRILARDRELATAGE